MKALEYYSNKTKIKYEDIYIIDIGANIGWYSIFFGKQGFKIISFEPSQLNNYILRKNFCLHKEINMTIINKGLYTEERKCDLFNIEQNKGNGLVICDHYNDNYIPFLSQKNVAMIKIDIEGSEARAITGGIELITKYHIPFIFLEFTPSLLKLQGNDPKEFLQLFVDNGYKISLYNFFNNYISVEDILKNKAYLLNLYLVYSKILE